MVILWALMMMIVSHDGKKDFEACKSEGFNPKACEKFKANHHAENF